MSERLLAKYSGAVPRYTSYPTAPHFHTGVNCDIYSQWLSELSSDGNLSLYIHIPYCDRLCWFCACHTKQTLRYEPITTYLAALRREIAAIGAKVPAGMRVTAIHFGGGSPTMLRPQDMIDLMACLKASFAVASDAEISVEMDPNDLDEARYDALAEIGLTRASLGVQDFDPVVQQAINRIQTFEQTKSVVDAVRARGVGSVNCDVLYGLPHQTLEGVGRTLSDILSLSPDRVALFGYAHVPWMKKHQTMIPENALPDVAERFRQSAFASQILLDAGYQPIGIDHFAKPSDSMAVAARTGTLRRNFQGYTTDSADALIGLGASSISQLPQGHVQNMPATGEYQRMVEGEGLAAVRGVELSEDDRMRAYVIERLMCDFGFDFMPLLARFPQGAHELISEARAFARRNPDDICRVGNASFSITTEGRPFTRTIAAVFDRYLDSGRGRHSIAV
jgi:oxygen-independent coproporphyrinogen-3 oxidase